jgi:hypothetical protein
MTPLDYIIDSALVLLVLIQIKERELTVKAIVRPLAIVAIAAANYLHGIPTAGNDLLLVIVLGLTGAAIGIASGQTLMMRVGAGGRVLARAGWGSAFFWVLGMGSRFAFFLWVSHGGAHTVGKFSATHAITGGAAWTAALLAMALFEVLGRGAVQAVRMRRLQSLGVPELA